MAMGTDLTLFADFMLQQGPAFLTGAEDILNLASKRTYVMKRLMQGKTQREMLQGGSTIKDQILFEAASDFAHYKPNESFDYSNPQGVDEWTVYWRFTKDSMQWTDHEIGLNSGEMSRKAKIHRFKKLKRTKEQRMMTSLLNNLDNTLLAQPNSATMEGSTGETPYSLICFVNEWSSDAATVSADYPGHPPGWTNVMGIDPDPVTAKTKWNNVLQSYSDVASAATNNLFKAFSKVFYRLRYDTLPMRPELGEHSTWPNFIGTSMGGMTNYEHLLRISQDSFLAGRQDPNYPSPTFRGVPLVYLSDFDTGRIFRTGAANTFGTQDETNNTAGSPSHAAGPRYMVITGEYICPVWHSERYFYKKKVELPRQPFNNVIVVDMWHNTVCRARNRHAMIYPTTNNIAY